ncbi:MAG: hypothetical protein JJ971_00450 [Balneolaceae bacterium]|nr:hypothetical protein [Balneolaceae bacterium]MBO6544841.1 hypothetical protein [Balneolaceae bacterium]MBO6646237.1 hypothetical protein [Balneolaceae bacterium]
MTQHNLIPKAQIDPKYKSVIKGDHTKYVHLHFDLNGNFDELTDLFNPFIKSQDLRLTWENFILPSKEQIEGNLPKISLPDNEVDQIISILLNPKKFGAPTAHATCKYSGNFTDKRFEKLIKLYEEGVEWIEERAIDGYLELEDVYNRIALRPKGDSIKLNEAPNKLNLESIDMIELSELDRHFRTTEIHISFENMKLVHPLIWSRIFKYGFYTAFKKEKSDNNKLSLIATIQGFDPEITYLQEIMRKWLIKEIEKKTIGCEVVIKKEDIISFAIFGKDTKIQKVVKPGCLDNYVNK